MSAAPMPYVMDREGKVVTDWYGFEKGGAEKEAHKELLKKPGL